MVDRSGVIPLQYTGASLLFAWIFLLFYANTAGIEAAAPVSLMSAPYTISALCMVATMLFVAFVPRIGIAELTLPAVKAIGPGMHGSGNHDAVLNGFDPSDGFHLALLVGGGVLTGISSGIVAQQWVVAYCRVGLKTIICSSPTLMAVAIGAATLIMYLPRPAMLAAIVALPLISG